MPPPGCCGCRWWGQAPTLQYMCIRGKCHHRFPGNFFVIMILLFQIKKPLFPMGTRTEKIFLRYHLVCRKSGHSARCQHTVCPLTLALRQKILWKNPFPPALSGPFAAPLFAPLSAPGTLCGCALQFYFRLNGFGIKLCLLYYRCVCLSRTNFRQRRTKGKVIVGTGF